MNKKYIIHGERIRIKAPKDSTDTKKIHNRYGTVSGPENFLYPIHSNIKVKIPLLLDAIEDEPANGIKAIVSCDWIIVPKQKSQRK